MEMNTLVLHTPSGGWSTNGQGAKIEKLWNIRQGRTHLTRAGKDQLENWNDFSVSVPVMEQEHETVRGPGRFHRRPRQTFLIF